MEKIFILCEQVVTRLSVSLYLELCQGKTAEILGYEGTKELHLQIYGQGRCHAATQQSLSIKELKSFF